MKKTALLLLFCMVILLTGCPKILKTVPNKKVVETIVNSFKLEFEKDQARYNCYARGYDFGENAQGITCQTSAGADKDKYAGDARRTRDEVISRFVRIIDNNYEQFANDLQNRRATANFLGDITELGLGAAVGITNGERALQILGVALTAFRGGRKSIDQNFYERQSTPILIAKMDTSRDRTMSAILQKKQKFGIDQYSLEDGLGDVIKYFWAGTLTRAFVELSKDASVQAKIAEDQLSVIKGVEINPIPTVARQRFSDDITTQRISLAKQFRDAEAITTATEKAAAIKKIVAKYEMIWRDIEAKSEFKSLVAEIKSDAAFNTTIGQFNNLANPPTRTQVNQLFAQFITRITEEDDKAGNTKLEEIFFAILKKANP